MRRAWTFRRFLLPLAGVVCWAGLSVGADLPLRPPLPPVDNDGLELDERAYFAPKPVLIEAVEADEELARAPALLPQRVREAEFEPPLPEPIVLQPADPQPIVEQPLEIYPNLLPPMVYAPPSHTTVPTCTGDVYNVSPTCEEGCGETICAGYCLPNWTIRAEAIIWDRAGGTNVPLVNDPVTLNTFDLDDGWRAGPRLTAIKHHVLNSWWDVEVSYFGIEGWSGTQQVVNGNNWLTNPIVNIGVPTTVTGTFSSSLQNGEINGRRVYNDWITWLVGFRILQVDEQLSGDFGGAASHSVETRNRLYGGQVGVDVDLFDGPAWQINAVAKAGIYGNTATQVTRTVGVGGALPFITFSDNQTCFVGEFGVNAGYHLTDRLTLIAGYNLLWVNGLALAPEQLANTNISTGVGALATNGNLLYHGVNLGLEYGW
jgi:hypothetical protein